MAYAADDKTDKADIQGVAGRWKFLAMLVLIYSCHSLDRNILFILVEPIRAEFGLSDGQIGLLTGLVYGVSFGIAALPVGFLVDRLDRRKLLGLAVILWSALTAFCAMARSFVALLFARAALGAVEAVGAPASLSIISDLFPARQRATAIGILYSSVVIGGLVGAVIAGVVVTQYGWRAGFLVAGIPGIILGLVMLFFFKEPERGATEKLAKAVAPMPIKEMLRFAARQPAFLNVLAGMTLSVAAMASTGVWLTAFFIRYHDLEIGEAAGVMGLVFGLGAALGSIGGGILSDLVSKNSPSRGLWLATAALIAIAPSMYLALTVESTIAAIAIVMVCVALFQGLLAPGFSASLGFVPTGMRGSAAAAAQLCANSVGTGLGPFIVGLLSDQLGGLKWALVIGVLICCIWSALHFGLAARGFARATNNAQRYNDGATTTS